MIAPSTAHASATPLSPPLPDHRNADPGMFALRELPPTEVVDGDLTEEGLLAEDVTPVGQMREACPYCAQPLQLVLRYRHVIRTHLFCQHCSRCFDACFADGSSALTRPVLPIY